MFFAQAQLDAVPAGQVKWFFAILFALIIVVGVIVGIIATFRKPGAVTINDNPTPEFRKAPKRYNHDLAEQRFGEHSRRLDGHDAEIEQIWQTMRAEDAAIRRENGAKFDAILLSLGEIKGELKKR